MPRPEKKMQWVRCTTGLHAGEPREMPEEMAHRLIERGQAETVTRSEIAAHIRFCAGEDGDALDTGEDAIVVEVRGEEGPPGGEEGAGDPPEEDAIEDGVIDGEDLDPETAEAIESLEPGRSQKKRKHRR